MARAQRSCYSRGVQRESARLGVSAFALLGLWLLSPSCSPKEEVDAATQYLDLRGRTLCAMGFRCCSPERQLRASQAECEERSAFHAGFKELEDAVANGTTQIDQARAKACFDQVSAMSCTEWAAALSGAVPAVCSGIFSGKANAQPCETNAECTTQFCDFTSGDHTLAGPQPTGLCATPAMAGGTCPAQGRGCVPGTQCRGSGGTPMCTPYVAEGGACTKDVDCVSESCSAGACAVACWAWPNTPHLLGTPKGF